MGEGGGCICNEFRSHVLRYSHVIFTPHSSVRFTDLNLHLADVIAFNSYEGWYPTGEPLAVDELQQIPELWDFTAQWAAANFPGKPVICSETGAGGIFGLHGPSDGQKWTEEVGWGVSLHRSRIDALLDTETFL